MVESPSKYFAKLAMKKGVASSSTSPKKEKKSPMKSSPAKAMKASSPKKTDKKSPMKKSEKKNSPMMKKSAMKAVKKPAKSSKPAKPMDKPDYYLIKSEPLTRIDEKSGQDMKFSIDDLMAEPNMTAEWDGVRNYQARNFMRSMKIGDKAFFYHSNAKPSGIVGIVEVVRESYPDFTQFDEKDAHYDPKSTRDNPRWDMVDVKYVRKLKRLIPLDELKKDPVIGDTLCICQGIRAPSVSPVTKKEWDYITKTLENKKV